MLLQSENSSDYKQGSGGYLVDEESITPARVHLSAQHLPHVLTPVEVVVVCISPGEVIDRQVHQVPRGDPLVAVESDVDVTVCPRIACVPG